MKTISTLVLLSAFAGSAGCESAARPPELVSARTVYDRAAAGPAANLNPTDLHTAKQSLDTAERSFADDGDTQATRDLAYTAQRRAEIAESRARTMQAVADKNKVIEQMNAGMIKQTREAAAGLARANQTVVAQGQALQVQGAALQTETERRQEAEKRAAQAAADLAKFASVKQEARGMVITLSGSVLFASGKADLLPAAQVKLNDVAKALTEQDPDSKMVVEGHTDSQGSAAFNQDLSQRRAQSVRDYLVSRGIASDRITAAGFGPSRSIADNGTAEGRANNRRVEIVVQPKQ
jgi:outer membrane protein OmpA-like peptidoglycan-associated protein